jgi:hypothetical protein
MSDIRFFTDEDVYGDVARILRSHGFDAVSTPEANRLSETDPSQLEWCRQQGRAIVSFNVGHFAAMHTQWAVAGRSTYGHHRVAPEANWRPYAPPCSSRANADCRRNGRSIGVSEQLAFSMSALANLLIAVQWSCTACSLSAMGFRHGRLLCGIARRARLCPVQGSRRSRRRQDGGIAWGRGSCTMERSALQRL